MKKNMYEKFINEDDFIMPQDDLLRGFTIQELMDVANANGEDIYTTFKEMLEQDIEYAEEMIEIYGSYIEEYMYDDKG